MADESKSYGLAWFLAGLGVGALVGILYAPKSGKETREDIANTAREGTQYVKVRTREAAENVSALVDKGKEHVSAIVDKSKEHVGEFVDHGREVVDRGRAQWEEFVERGKNLVADQSGRVAAAVDAGRQAYNTAAGEPETREF
jgi:gas vesicle protein